jgi:hypothetical protein
MDLQPELALDPVEHLLVPALDRFSLHRFDYLLCGWFPVALPSFLGHPDTGTDQTTTFSLKEQGCSPVSYPEPPQRDLPISWNIAPT